MASQEVAHNRDIKRRFLHEHHVAAVLEHDQLRDRDPSSDRLSRLHRTGTDVTTRQDQHGLRHRDATLGLVFPRQSSSGVKLGQHRACNDPDAYDFRAFTQADDDVSPRR